MSAPTRGMVAGQIIKTGAQTQEFDEGYERTFGGGRRPKRGRTVYTSGGVPLEQPIEVDTDWQNTQGRAQTATEELVYGNAKATDGTPINSRKRHREYLKQNGLAMAQDFSEGYRQREASLQEAREDRKTREMVERNVYKVFGG